MRLMLAVTAVALISSAAIAATGPNTGSGAMMGSGNMMGTGTTKGSAMAATSGTFLIHHKVADYAKWRVAYDADQANRTSAGLTNCKVQRAIDDASDVLISCSMADVAKAKAFSSSKTLADTMTKAGVMGKPEFLFLASPK